MKWKTKDGREVEVSNLGDNHLLNIERYMGRVIGHYAKEAAACASCVFQGDMAQYYQEQDMMMLSDKVSDGVIVREVIRREVKRRNLKVRKVSVNHD